ncbi:MAG: helix-turn-helix domain-containing protein [Adlercreutzia equolifaciens]
MRPSAPAPASSTSPFNRQQLADYLGVDRSALSAELSRMQKAGLIRCRRNHFALPHSPSNSTVEK